MSIPNTAALSTPPFQLEAGGSSLDCRTLLRHLPGRRVVCAGIWNGRPVVVKLYLPHQRARRHAKREERGVRALLEHGILTPALLFAGTTHRGRILVFERIEGATSVRDLWHQSDMAERRHLLNLMARAVAFHHEAGLVQNDLHLGNFLYAEGRLYSIDGDGFRVHRRLSQKRALSNLALLLAQLRPDNDPLFADAYRVYCDERGWENPPDVGSFIEQARRRRTSSIDAHLTSKIFRECTAFTVHSTWHCFTVTDRAYATPSLREALSDPDHLISAGRPLKRGRTSTVSMAVVDQRPMVIKRYNIKNKAHALRRAFRETRASISWRNGHRLSLYGIPTPEPIALIERRRGPLRGTSYIVTAYHDGHNAWEYFRRASLEEASETARRIVNLLTTLRRMRLSHGDLKATNFLITDEDVLLTDLDALKQHRTERAAALAHQKDLGRFMQNWRDLPRVREMFQRLLDEEKRREQPERVQR